MCTATVGAADGREATQDDVTSLVALQDAVGGAVAWLSPLGASGHGQRTGSADRDGEGRGQGWMGTSDADPGQL
jgi:hypothetical protein